MWWHSKICSQEQEELSRVASCPGESVVPQFLAEERAASCFLPKWGELKNLTPLPPQCIQALDAEKPKVSGRLHLEVSAAHRAELV